jgi:hypothetical protein
VRRGWPRRPDGVGNRWRWWWIQRTNEDATAETEGDQEKRVSVSDEESRGESEKEMAEETGRRRKPVVPTMNLDEKCERVGEGDKSEWSELNGKVREREGRREMDETTRVSLFYMMRNESRPSIRSTVHSVA